MTDYNQIFKDCLNDDCLDPETLEIIPDQLFKKCKNPEMIGILLDEFEMIKGSQPYYSGLKEKHKFAAANKKTLYLGLADHILTKYEDRGRYRWPHAQQRRTLEKIIRLLDKADRNKDADDKISLARAKAHLYRSRLIRPKGLTVPAKKIEGLYKALDSCLESDKKWHKHYAGVIALELDRCGQSSENLFENDRPDKEPANLFDLLTKAIRDNCLSRYEWHHEIEFYKMRFRLEELKLGNADKKKLFNDPVFKKKIFKHKAKVLRLERLKAAIYCDFDKQRQDDLTDELIESLSKPRVPFSHVIWDDAVRFVRRLRKYKYDAWQNLAIEMWKTADTKAIYTTSLQLRWYWARQRNLYDLAFLAAYEQGDMCQAAKIADSAKSKPALTWQALENLSRTDKRIKAVLRRELDYAAKALAGVYIPRLGQNSDDPDIRRTPDKFPDLFDTETIVVQFYLVHLDEEKTSDDAKNGYALIYDKNKGGWSKKNVERFNCEPLFEKYINWQNTYFRLSDKWESAGDLEKLCEEMGKELAFLLNYRADGKNRRMILIPHDFLHRVPLHGVLRKKDNKPEILLEKFRCSYLPALTGYALKSHYDLKQTGMVALRYFDKDDKLIEIYDETENYFDKYKPFATKKDLAETMNTPPRFLALVGHGSADYINPFLSKLKFNPALTLLEIATVNGSFAGSDIFINACETDLAGPLDTPLDEHLSIASIFFNKNANTVLSTIYKIFPIQSKVLNLLEKIKSEQFDAIYAIQQDLWDEYQGCPPNPPANKSQKLYHCLTYKNYCWAA